MIYLVQASQLSSRSAKKASCCLIGPEIGDLLFRTQQREGKEKLGKITGMYNKAPCREICVSSHPPRPLLWPGTSVTFPLAQYSTPTMCGAKWLTRVGSPWGLRSMCKTPVLRRPFPEMRNYKRFGMYCTTPGGVRKWVNHLALHINVHWNMGVYQNVTAAVQDMWLDKGNLCCYIRSMGILALYIDVYWNMGTYTNATPD